MKIVLSTLRILFCTLLCVSFFSCSNSGRQVVPYDVDTDEIFKALPPNDDESPDNLTFGENRIPGITFDVDFTTDNEDVYIYFNNLTLLEINPKINQALFEFILAELCDYGFINQSVSLPQDEYENYIQSGLSYKDAAAHILDTFKAGFEEQTGNVAEFNYPFNAYFQIYPIFLNDSLVTYRESAYFYTGGAHGSTISHLITYDLFSGKALNFEDIVKPEDSSFVREEVAAHMAYSYPIYENITTVDQYIDSLNVWLDLFNNDDPSKQISASDFPISDVAVTNEGLAFIYPMYDLTPGSDGCPLVVIPYSDIKGCLSIPIKH